MGMMWWFTTTAESIQFKTPQVRPSHVLTHRRLHISKAYGEWVTNCINIYEHIYEHLIPMVKMNNLSGTIPELTR